MKFRLSCVVLLLFGAVYGANVTYTFGVNLGLNSSQYGQLQRESLQGYEIWRDAWNALPPQARTTRWGDVVSVELHIETFSSYGYTEVDHQGVYERYAWMKNNLSIDFFFTTTAWEGVKVREYASEYLGIHLMLGPTDSSEAYYSIPGSFGTTTANVLTMTQWIAQLRIWKAKTLAVLQVNDVVTEGENGVYQYEMCSGLVSQVPLGGLTVLKYFPDMPFDWWTLGKIEGDKVREEAWRAALAQVREADPDAVIICDYTYGAEFSLNYMRENDWTPKFVGISPLNSGTNFRDPSLLAYVTTPSSYDARARFPAQEHFTDSAGYDRLAREKYGVPATSTMAESTFAGMLYTDALMNSPSNSTEDITFTLQRRQMVSFMGTSVFDVYNRQTMMSLMMQFSEGGKDAHIVGPIVAADRSPIYPMPTWKERIFNPKWGSRVEVAGLVLMVLGVLSNVIWAILIITHWNQHIIRASSPVFCLTLLAGGILVHVSLFSWMPNLVNGAMCSLRALLLPLGFMALFGSLIAKSDRIHRIFSSDITASIKISDLQVALVILVILVIQVLLSVLATTVTSLTAKLHVVDEYRVSYNYYVCSASVSLWAIFGINVAYAVLLLGWGTYLAYHIRLIPYGIYDESKTIIFSIYNATFFCTIVIVIQLAVGNNSRELTFMVTAACSFLGVMITTCTLFVPKFKSIYAPTDSHSTRDPSHHSSNNQAKIDSLMRENGRLRTKLAELGHPAPSTRGTTDDV